MNISVNGMNVENYLEVFTNVNMEKIGGTFAFSCTDEVANVGDSVRIDGVMTGFILKKTLEKSKDCGSIYTFSGVDRLAFLCNCQLPRYKTFRQTTFRQIVLEIISELRNATDFNILEMQRENVREFQINAGENIGETLSRLAAHTGRFIYSRSDGVIEVATAGAGTSGENRIDEDSIINLSEEINIEKTASDIQGRTNYISETGARNEVNRRIATFPPRLHIPNFLTGGRSQREINNITQRRFEEVVVGMTTIKIEQNGFIGYALNGRTLYNTRFYNLKGIEFRRNKNDGARTIITLGGLPL